MSEGQFGRCRKRFTAQSFRTSREAWERISYADLGRKNLGAINPEAYFLSSEASGFELAATIAGATTKPMNARAIRRSCISFLIHVQSFSSCFEAGKFAVGCTPNRKS
jgi:hypothetical protein